jgi:putative MATE family efflux protein
MKKQKSKIIEEIKIIENASHASDIDVRRHFYAKLFAIALPMALQNLVTSSLNLIDTFMISSLSTASIAGVTAANKLFFILFLFLFGISSGSSILTAQYWGVKDVKNIRRVLGICLMLGISGAFLFTTAALFVPEIVMRIFTNQPGAISEGASYLRIIGLSYIPTSITFAYVFILRSTGNVKLPMKISIIAIILNTFLNWVLIYGNLGAPALGVSGAAIATVIARGLEFALLMGIIYRNNEVAAARLNELLDINKTFFAKYMKTVLPVIFNELIWAVGVTMYDLVYGRMGESVMAAMGITKTIEQMTFFFIYSLGNASGVILGNQMGTGDMTQVFNYAKKLVKIMVIIGLSMSAILFIASGPLANFFQVEPLVATYIQSCIRVLAIVTVVKGLNMLIIVGILRSGGDTTFAMYLDGGAVWLVAVPLVFLGGFVWKLEIQYVYMLALTEEFVKVSIGLYRVWSKKWINNLIFEE